MGLNATLDNNVSGYVFILNYLAGIRLCSTIQGLIVIYPISLIKRSGHGGGIFRPLTLRHRQNCPAPRDHHLPFSLRSLPLFLLPHISSPHATLRSPPSSCFLGAVCGRCHNRRWNRFICCNVVWAAAWHGAEQHSFFFLFFFLLPVASVPGSSPSPVCSSSCVFKQANQHHSDTLASLFSLSLFLPSLPLPPTISALSVSVKKKKSHQSSSLTHTPLSLMANSNGHTVLFFTAFIFIKSPLLRPLTNPLPLSSCILLLRAFHSLSVPEQSTGSIAISCLQKTRRNSKNGLVPSGGEEKKQ